MLLLDKQVIRFRRVSPLITGNCSHCSFVEPRHNIRLWISDSV